MGTDRSSEYSIMECSIVVELPLYWMFSERIIALHLMEVGLKKSKFNSAALSFRQIYLGLYKDLKVV